MAGRNVIIKKLDMGFIKPYWPQISLFAVIILYIANALTLFPHFYPCIAMYLTIVTAGFFLLRKMPFRWLRIGLGFIKQKDFWAFHNSLSYTEPLFHAHGISAYGRRSAGSKPTLNIIALTSSGLIRLFSIANRCRLFLDVSVVYWPFLCYCCQRYCPKYCRRKHQYMNNNSIG